MLGFYIITTGISFGIYYLSSNAYNNYLERKGYVSNEPSKSLAETKFNLLSLAFKALIPGYNIYTAIQILWEGPKQFDKMAADELKSGSIRKLTIEEIKEIENKKAKEEEKVIVSEKLNYEEMTNEEKIAFLEKEREELLKLKESNEEESKQLRIGTK